MSGPPNAGDAFDFDPERLRRFLETHFPIQGRMRLERIAGGQSNPTFFLDIGDQRVVLRKKPAGQTLKGAHAVDREFRILTALVKTPVPAPKPILFCSDADVIGTPFYLMERLDGRVFHDAALPGLAPAERRAVYLEMAAVLARLHALRPEEIGLENYGASGNYFERQIARWSRQWSRSDLLSIDELDALAAWLPNNVPSDDSAVSIAHGDFRLGNLIFHPTEPTVIGILDWELSTLGHPLADLGFCCMPWHTSPDEYGGILGLDRAQLGIPSVDDFVRHYYAHAIPTGELTPFHVIFALFRFAVIFVGIAERSQAGNAAGQDAETLPPLAKSFARRAWSLASSFSPGLSR